MIPKAGSVYTIVKGDTLWGIATVVYGSGRKYDIIWEANKTSLRSGDPNLIYPGEKVFIPKDPNDLRALIDIGRDISPGAGGSETLHNSDIMLEIDGMEIKTGAITVLVTLDSPADGWTASIPRYHFEQITDSIKPYQYNQCRVMIGGNYMGDTVLYNLEESWSPNNAELIMEGYSPVVDIMDSYAEGPYQAENITFEDWMTQKCKPFSIPVEMDAVSSDEKFKRVKMSRDQRIYDYFSELGRIRGYIIANNKKGGVRVFDWIGDETIVATFSDVSNTPIPSGTIRWSGRDRFRKTVGRGSGPKKNISRTEVDEYIRRERMRSITVNDTTEEKIAEAILAERNRTLEGALTLKIPIFNFHNDNGELFWPGQFISVDSRHLRLEKPFTFVIKECEFVQNGNSRTGSLTVTPPSVYTKEKLVDPWNTAL